MMEARIEGGRGLLNPEHPYGELGGGRARGTFVDSPHDPSVCSDLK